MLAINTEDDSANPPELDVMPRLIARVKRGRYVLIPRSADTAGHASYTLGKLYAPYVRELLSAR